jgi:hypothetical protein
MQVEKENSSVCMRNEVSTTIRLQRLQCWHYLWEGYVKCSAEMTSGGITYTPSFMKIVLAIQVILRLLTKQV